MSLRIGTGCGSGALYMNSVCTRFQTFDLILNWLLYIGTISTFTFLCWGCWLLCIRLGSLGGGGHLGFFRSYLDSIAYLSTFDFLSNNALTVLTFPICLEQYFLQSVAGLFVVILM